MSLRDKDGVIHVPRVRIEEQIAYVIDAIEGTECEEDREVLREGVAYAQAKLANAPDAPSIAVTHKEMVDFGWYDFS